jgi:hypothetical protein
MEFAAFDLSSLAEEYRWRLQKSPREQKASLLDTLHASARTWPEGSGVVAS